MKGDQRDSLSRYGKQPLQQAQATWACLLDATSRAAFEESDVGHDGEGCMVSSFELDRAFQ